MGEGGKPNSGGDVSTSCVPSQSRRVLAADVDAKRLSWNRHAEGSEALYGIDIVDCVAFAGRDSRGAWERERILVPALRDSRSSDTGISFQR
jgi:hypothetical protein